MYFTYAIFNKKHKKIYIGQTKDLENRLKLHAEKIFKNSYTARFNGDWQIIYKEEFETKAESLRREKQLKSYRGREFIHRIVDNL